MDNAIESARPNFPIYLTISCVDDHLLIKQANATFDQLTDEQIKRMVEAGVSTKAKYGRGYGLYNLKLALKKWAGQLTIRSYDDKLQESNYLEFTITISAYAQFKQNKNA